MTSEKFIRSDKIRLLMLKLTSCAIPALLATTTGTSQAPLGREDADMWAHLALQGLDRYMENLEFA
jgi:hypothetical protein